MPETLHNAAYGSVAAILMASGFSRRFGERNKLLVPFRGKALARYTLDLVTEMDFSGGIFFVTASSEVAALAADLSRVKVIENDAPEKGRRESIGLGLKAAGTLYGTGYYLFLPCDQPFLDVYTIQDILSARRHGCIVEPRCQGNPGNPCLFSAVFREELLSLKEGETPHIIKTRHQENVIGVEVKNQLALKDIDDEEMLKQLSL